MGGKPMCTSGEEPGGFGRGLGKHSRRGRPARMAATLLLPSAFFLIMACAAPPAQNQNATPGTTPLHAAPPGTTSTQAATVEGDVRITPITHASFQLEYDGKVIHVDPTSAG